MDDPGALPPSRPDEDAAPSLLGRRPPRLQRPAPALCPVTALAFFRRPVAASSVASTAASLFVLAGEDGWLAVYAADGSGCRGRLRVFADQAIQGCRVGGSDDGDVLVWGGRSVAWMARQQIVQLVDGDAGAAVQAIRAPDWVYDAVLPSSSDDGSMGALVTAHNEVLPFSVDRANALVVLADRPISPPSRPMLFSARLAWESNNNTKNNLLVAAGTVFGEIVVWTCRLSERREQTAVQVLHTFAGHEGSVFDVALSPELSPAGEHGRLRLLASCSDDRTIRVWPVFVDRPVDRAAAVAVDDGPRETGFRDELTCDAALAVTMAHASRIWHVQFGAVTTSTAGRQDILVYSFGEDATAQEWHLDVAAGRLVHSRTVASHVGKNIWAAAVLSGPRSLVATGACDGKICLFEGGRQQQQQGSIISASVPPKSSEDKPSHPKKSREELFNSYAFFSDNQLLAATTHGRLFLGRLEPNRVSWEEVPAPDTTTAALAEYNVVRSSSSSSSSSLESVAFVGTASGRLFLYSAGGGLQEMAVTLPGKIGEMLSLPAGPEAAALPMLVTVLFHQEVFILDVAVSDHGALLSATTTTVELPHNTAAITAATRCCGHLVLGSRKGELLLFQDDGATLITQVQTRTRDAILAIVPLPPQSCSSFVVTTRDGTYRIYTIDMQRPDEPRLCLRHETAPPFGPIVRDAWFFLPDSNESSSGGPPELVLCGFRSTQFVLWNETRQEELAAVDCGGTHRSHSYRLWRGGDGRWHLRFAFTRSGRLCFFSRGSDTTTNATTLKTGGHGREIKAVSTSASGAYVATSSEDTVVRIWAVDGGSGGRCLAVLKRHNTGVHNLAWLGDDCLVSAAGSEELFVWRIARIADSTYAGLAVLAESCGPESRRDNKILRITALDASLEDAENSIITVALSSSVFRTFRYSSAAGWQRLAVGRYTGACPAQMRHLRLRPNSELVVLAAFADGHLALWRALPTGSLLSDYALIGATPVHRNAVKSMDLGMLGPDRAVVLTGGDDNAVAVTPVRWRDAEYTFGQTVRVAQAHAAAINGMCLLGEPATDAAGRTQLTAVSCSNDQRVKAWRVLLGAESSSQTRVQLLDDQYSAIADPGDLARLKKNEAMVVGMGMETWRL